MNIFEAVKVMEGGKKVARPKMSGYYLAILPRQNYIWQIGSAINPIVNALIFEPSIDDIKANDYTIVD